MDPFELDTITPESVGEIVRQFRSGGAVAAGGELVTEPEEIKSGINLLGGGAWYVLHPDKLLGDTVIEKDRYGKDIKVVVGTIANLSAIDAADDFMQFVKAENIGVSTIAPNISELATLPDQAEFIESVIEKSNADIGAKAVRKVRKAQIVASEAITPSFENIQTYETIFRTLNPAITSEELKAYIWYKADIGQRLSDEWYRLSGLYLDTRSEEQMVRDWVDSGVLCYYDGQLLPSVLYLSGNIYSKISRIVKAGENSGQDIDVIVGRYGQAVLGNQLAAINAKYSELYSKRLLLTGNEDGNSLIIKPISDIARDFTITSLQEFETFKWWEKGGKPNWEREDGSQWHKVIFERLSLTDAFCFWLLNVGRGLDIKGNITYRDIIYFYIDGRTKVTPAEFRDTPKEAEFKAQLARTKSKAMSEGNRLFLVFLNEQLEINDRIRLETAWNSSFNNYIAPDFNKIPVAFNVAKEFGGEIPFVVKPEKREAVSFIFNEGSGCLAYDVGVGKTMSAIMATEQFLVAGYCKRPVIVVPNQTYKQWISEIRGILPHRKINGLFNLGVDFLEETYDEEMNPTAVAEGSISVITYEGLKAIGFNEETESKLMNELYEILNQGDAEGQMSKKRSEKKVEGFRAKLESLIGRGLKGTVVPIETLGFDYICLDEAHAVKKVFTSVKGETGEDGKKERNPYSINSGTPSDTALKAFMLAQYILRTNNYRNVVMLTATPFTNSPLEVFSMLSMLAYHQLKEYRINNIKDFFDTYIDANTELTINHKLQPQYKQIVKGFNNLPALQRLVLRFFNYKDGDDVGVVRPNKIVIPYLKQMVNGIVVDLPENDRVPSYIELNAIQQGYMDEIIAYAEGKSEIDSNGVIGEDQDGPETSMVDTEAQVVSESHLSSEEKSGVRALKAMNYSRNLALSPFLYEHNRLGKPTYKSYVETSPKLQYVMDCIASVKKYHEKNGEPVSGQVIYMDRGVQYFPLLAEYLQKVIGFEPHEIGMITSKGMSVDKKRAVQDGFLGRKYNEKTKEYEDIPDSQRIKVLIGSSSIKEGMNLQKKSTVLYNCFLDYNPTDMIQLQGRIWRQQNEFLYVRIVNPLMIDSIDIFMFQKLEEKTSRINTIWSNDGRSVLKIEEVNPSEIKYALIKDPEIIAKIEVDEKSVHFQDDIKSNEVLAERLRNYINASGRINSNLTELTDLYRKFISDKQASADIMVKALGRFFSLDNPKDKDGRVMISDYDRKYNMRQMVEKYGEISPMQKPYRPYWWDYFVVALRLVEKENRDLLTPRSIDKANVDAYIDFLENSNKEIAAQMEFLKSPDYVQTRVAEIVTYRENNKIEIMGVAQLVEKFATLNHLLSEKRIKKPVEAKPIVFKRTEPDGMPRTDAETLAELDRIVMALPQTKDSHVDINGMYFPERLKIHNEIIKKLKEHAQCITQDQPIAILTGGSPASGKTTFLRSYAPYLLQEEIFHIDADEVRSMLPEYEGWNAAATHLEAKDIVNTLISDREIGIPCRTDIIYDGTMNSSKNYLPLIGLLKKLGYRIFIIYMDNVPYSTIRKRLIERYRKSGRYVPTEVVDDFFVKGKDAFYELREKVDGFMVVDAGSRDYKIIERGGMSLPTSRMYSDIQDLKPVDAPKDDIQEMREAVDALEVLAMVTKSKKELREINDAIESIKVLILLEETNLVES